MGDFNCINTISILSFDVEKQEVIELPMQTGIMPIKNDQNDPSLQLPTRSNTESAKEMKQKPQKPVADEPSPDLDSTQEITTIENTAEENSEFVDVRSVQQVKDDQKDK